MRDNTGKPMGTFETEHCGPDGGGFCTSYSSDDTGQYQVHGTDVGNGYAKGPADKIWRRLFTLGNIPDLDTYWQGMPEGSTNADGCFAIGVCATDGAQGYGIFRGMLWRLTQGLTKVDRVGTSYYRAPSNETASRLYNDKLVVDPFNPGAVVFTTKGAGVFYHIAGTTSAPVKLTGPADQSLPCLIGADRSAGKAGALAKRWLVYAQSEGLWQSTAGPAGPYSKVAATITTEKSHMYVAADGAVYLAGSGKIDKYSAGAWSVEMAKGDPATFAISGEGKKLAFDFDGNCYFPHLDGTWPGDTYRPNYPLAPGFIYTANDPGCRWLGSENARLFPSKIVADPLVQDKFHMVHGTGICSLILPKERGMYDRQYGPIEFVDESAGNAMLVTMKAVTQPISNRVLRTAWDKPIWISTNEQEANDPAGYFPPYIGVEIGNDVDWVPGNEDHIVALINQTEQHACQSFDGGDSWEDFSFQHPSGYSAGGCMAFVSETEGYWLPSNNGRAVYTTTGGNGAWQYLDLVTAGGVHLPTSGESGFGYAYYFNKKNLVSSKEEPGVAYLYNYGPEGSEALRGVWRKEAGSTKFVQVLAGVMPGANVADFYYHMHMAEVPGHAGYLLMSSGNDQAAAQLRRCKDRGVTWTGVTTSVAGAAPAPIYAVSRFGFGVNLPGASVPAIRYFGVVGGVPALYETLDDFTTSTLIEARPLGLTEIPGSITGDWQVFGTWYYGIGQQGWAKATRKHLLTIS
jgi:hypothetical protein